MVAETKISYKLAKNLEWGGKSRQLKEYWKGSQGWENEMIPKVSWFKVVWHQNKYRNSKYWVAGRSRDLHFCFAFFFLCFSLVSSMDCLTQKRMFSKWKCVQLYKNHLSICLYNIIFHNLIMTKGTK